MAAKTAARRSTSSGLSDSAATAVHSSSPPSSASGNRDGRSSEAVMNDFLFPSDSYQDGIYWAALPAKERHRFINREQNKEWGRELGVIWQDFKSDPLLPAIKYWRTFVLPGMGLFTEGYVLFSISNVKTLFQKVWPQCWQNYRVCNKTLTQTTDYLQVVGIILGQVTVGVEGDWIGRRWGLIQDAGIMLVATILLTGVWGAGGSLQGWVIGYAIAQLIYGFGVGGEYPMTATLAMEGASSASADKTDRLHRGRRTVGAFLMQGWGQVINQAVLIILLLIFNSGSSGPYSEGVGQATYRVSFALVALFILWLLYYRIWRLKGSNKAIERAKKKSNVSGYDVTSLKLAFSFYWHRILATAIGWFCNDFFFYGNKIFAQSFISIVTPSGTSIMPNYLWNFLNTGISLVGYYFAFLLIDDKRYGRRTMQFVGFSMDFILFVIAAFAFGPLTQPGAGVKGFQFLYYFSSFWAQFGPNCVTFLVAAEVYPANIRGSAHGFSAAVGKLGALAPTIMFNYIPARSRFLVTCWFALLGAIVTMVFLPDVTGLDLREQERRWKYCMEGRPQDYHGIAVHRRHLSFWEVYVLKQHLQYDPVIDRQQRIEELRQTYFSEVQDAQASEKGVGRIPDEDSELPPAVHRIFEQERLSSSSEGLLAAPAKFSGRLGQAGTGGALH